MSPSQRPVEALCGLLDVMSGAEVGEIMPSNLRVPTQSNCCASDSSEIHLIGLGFVHLRRVHDLSRVIPIYESLIICDVCMSCPEWLLYANRASATRA